MELFSALNSRMLPKKRMQEVKILGVQNPPLTRLDEWFKYPAYRCRGPPVYTHLFTNKLCYIPTQTLVIRYTYSRVKCFANGHSIIFNLSTSGCISQWYSVGLVIMRSQVQTPVEAANIGMIVIFSIVFRQLAPV